MGRNIDAIQRRALAVARKTAMRGGFPREDLRLSQLILIQPTAANKPVLTFDPTLRTRSTEDGEVRVVQNDTFFAYGVALGVRKVVDGKTFGNVPSIFYPESTVFSGAAIAPSQADEKDAIEALYNASLNIQTDQDSRVENFHTSILRSSTETQNADHPSHTHIPFQSLENIFEINGDKTNSIRLDMGATDISAIEGAATETNYVVLHVLGYKLINGSKAITVAGNKKRSFRGRARR